MKSKLLYPVGLCEFLRNNRYIPRRVKEQEHLKTHHKYYSIDMNRYFKVLDVYQIGNIEYYSIRYSNTMQAEISYPITDEIYELLTDFSCIKNKAIINCGEYYSGAEIRYWFFSNNIDLNEKDYYGFWGFLDSNSKSKIIDEKRYVIRTDYENGIHKNVRVITQTTNRRIK
jgi:hypothetical protein